MQSRSVFSSNTSVYLSDESTIGSRSIRRPGRTVDKLVRQIGARIEYLVSTMSIVSSKKLVELEWSSNACHDLETVHESEEETQTDDDFKHDGNQDNIPAYTESDTSSTLNFVDEGLGAWDAEERFPDALAMHQNFQHCLESGAISQNIEMRSVNDPCLLYSDDPPTLKAMLLLAETRLFKLHPGVVDHVFPLLGEFFDTVRKSRHRHPFNNEVGQFMERCQVVYVPNVTADDIADSLDCVYEMFIQKREYSSALHAPASAMLPLVSIIRILKPLILYNTRHPYNALLDKCTDMLQEGIFSYLASPPPFPSSSDETPFKLLHLIRLARPHLNHLLPLSFLLCALGCPRDVLCTPLLNDTDKVKCLRGRYQISDTLSASVYSSGLPGSDNVLSPECPQAPQCRIKEEENSTVALVSRLSENSSMTISKTSFFLTTIGASAEIFCEICSRALRTRWLRHIWDPLPKFFDLGTWEDIQVQSVGIQCGILEDRRDAKKLGEAIVNCLIPNG